ncbi:DNA cytosine methyltransferase [bacterium]|nr:DNA cytosine methyltransferase [bacterium]
MSYSVFETFVGAGGSHLGFKNNGFKSIFVNDIDENCIKTLLFNNPEIKQTALVNIGDMRLLNANDILNKLRVNKKDIDVMFGGIVCKGFSLAGERSPNDPRNTFYRYQLNLVSEIQPKISIIENVPGIINSLILKKDTPNEIKNQVDEVWQDIENYKGEKAQARKENKITKEIVIRGENLRKRKNEITKLLEKNECLISVYEDIQSIYKTIGYNLYKQVLNSASYGSYTKRERVIIVAVRSDIKDEFIFPIPIYNDEKDYKTVGDALKLIDYSNKDDEDNRPMNHALKTVERLKYLKEGQNIVEIMDKLPNELKISKFYSRGSTMRLDSTKPSPTLVPGHSNFPIHPFENRSITVREAAVITGFPLNYKFFGNHTKRCEQVGNAVPIELSTALAKSCKDFLDKISN